MAKRGRKKKGRLLPSFHLKPETVKSIFFIFFLILSIISIFSFLQIGPLPTRFNQILDRLFGFGSVFVPFLLVLVSFSFTKIKSPLRELNVFLGFVIMFISVISLFGEGLAGLFLFNQLLTLIGEKIIVYLIYFFSFIVGFVVLFDTSVVQIVKFFIKVFLMVKKYTIGNIAKAQKTKDKETRYIQSELSPEDSNSKDKDKEEKSSSKTNLGVVGIAPILKQPASLSLSSKSTDNPETQIWQYPPISLFDESSGTKADRGDVRKNANTIEQTLDSFGITARVAEVNNSPSVTQYALEVALGTKLAKIVSLSNDLAMALAAPGGQIRVEAPIPGRSLVGIEVPNRSLEIVPIRQILDADVMKTAKSKIAVPLGKDVGGIARIADIAKMPHVLIAGQTGSGKSVCINSWICSILFRASPSEVRLILVDPKRVELTPYNGIPHLLTPVIVEPEKVISALKWASDEMERRYKMFTEVGAKNIEGYNNIAGFQSIPYIIIFIDELAEIMLFSPAEVEENVCRIAQMARATGIHLVLATQRPSVNVITGLIKANIPARMAFAVASMMDSRVILDTPGAEKLLGRGDMLYIPPDLAKPVRIQGCFISDKEIGRLIDYLKAQKSANYDNQVTSQSIANPDITRKNLLLVDGEERDELFEEALKLIQQTGRASASLFQRHLKLGYARAARLLDQLQSAGIVGPGKGAKPRDILIPHNTSSDSEV